MGRAVVLTAQRPVPPPPPWVQCARTGSISLLRQLGAPTADPRPPNYAPPSRGSSGMDMAIPRPATPGRAKSPSAHPGGPVDNPFRSCGTPVLSATVPKSSTACARRRPHFWPSASVSPRALLCSCRLRDHEPAGDARGAEPATDSRGRAAGPAPGAGHPGGVHRRRALQHPGRQRAARQPRSAAGRTGAAHQVQLPPRGRLGRAKAEGLHPRRDRSARGRGDARGPVPLPDRAQGAPRPPGRVAGEGEPQELDRPHRRLHPGDHRLQRPVRRGGTGLSAARSTSRWCRCRSPCGCGRT